MGTPLNSSDSMSASERAQAERLALEGEIEALRAKLSDAIEESNELEETLRPLRLRNAPKHK